MAEELRLWLEGIGLAQLADIFAENDIDLDLLPELSDEDLKELGLSLGQRRRLLRAVAERKSEPTSAVEAIATGPALMIPAEALPGDPERRQLTVMFCDLVGSTELSGRLDPEDLRELTRRYQDAVAGVVERHVGYIANFLGDGIIAYFGWPLADEDAASQAVRAGLDAVAAVGRLMVSEDTPLRARVGIASGTVVVGDLEAAGRRQQAAIAGEAPNLAARLQGLAPPGAVVIGGLVRSLIGAAFALEDLGPQSLKGITAPVPAWRVLGERSVESRFETREGGLTPLIGREQELALLVDRFERAAAGEGQVVLLSGEAGIGKSRLVAKLDERLSLPPSPPTRIRLQCSPFHMTTLLYPVFRHLEHAASFAPNDTPELRLDKLEALLRRGVEDVSETMALLAPLLSLPGAERYGTIELPAEQRKERVLRALGDQLRGLALRNPVVAIFEDAHWLDPTTRELIEHLLARIAEMPMLLLITHRPEFQSDWARHPHLTALTLNRLSRGQSVEMVRTAGGVALPEELVARIGRRADGVPLFIEELTRSALDGGATGEDDIPETLQGSLMARLDRLGGEAKELAQIAAVIGREFDARLLAAVTGKPAEALATVLRQLGTSQVVLPNGSVPDGYTFRHALLQDAAYQSLLSSRRRHYHAAIAESIERDFPETAEGQPALVAQHFAMAEMPERAIPFWLLAGERSCARLAILEAIGHFERGLEMARALPQSPQRSGSMLALLLALGDARQMTLAQLAQALTTYREAAEIARALGAATDLARAARGAALTESWIGDPARPETADLLEAALRALGDADSGDRSYVLASLGWALMSVGQLERAGALAAEAIAVARRCGDKHALYFALSRQIFGSVGRPCPAALFPQRRRTLDEERALSEAFYGVEAGLTYGFAPTAAYLEMGDYEGFSASLIRFNDYASNRRISSFGYGLASAEAMRAILVGEFADAERLAERAHEIGRDVQGELATGVYGVQMFTIRREQGRLAEVAPVLKRFIDDNPRDAAWRPGLALIASDLGFTDAARKAFADLAAAGFDFPPDAKRTLTLSYLAEVCTHLGDAIEAERLYEQLLPYRDNAILAPVATVCCGAASRYLGMLAGVLGEWDAAEEHFTAALDLDQRLHAWPWLAHTKHEFALMLRARGRQQDQNRAADLLAAAAASAERIGMPALQQKIRSQQR